MQNWRRSAMNIASLFSMILSSQKNDSFKFSFRSQEHPAKGMTCQQYFHELEVICKKDQEQRIKQFVNEVKEKKGGDYC